MTSVQPSELRAFFSHVIGVFERLEIPYMVVGGFAAIFYGEPRLTLDVDVVVDMQFRHVQSFVQAFPIPEFYVSQEAILDSLTRKYPFNVIQPSTGAKVDVVPLPDDSFSRLAFQRRQPLVFDPSGLEAYFITEEDIVIARLIAFRETDSEKHFRDARGIMLLQWDTIDMDALRRGAERDRGVHEPARDLPRCQGADAAARQVPDPHRQGRGPRNRAVRGARVTTFPFPQGSALPPPHLPVPDIARLQISSRITSPRSRPEAKGSALSLPSALSKPIPIEPPPK